MMMMMMMKVKTECPKSCAYVRVETDMVLLPTLQAEVRGRYGGLTAGRDRMKTSVELQPQRCKETEGY